MGKIFNFIIIDQFTLKRQQSIYFLTHWHSDHYQGITNNWTYGPIYCSPITSKLLLSKYPKTINQVKILEYNKTNQITNTIINSNGQQEQVYLKIKIYDSNHMAGSIMMLIQYQGKYYLHTGDMRFNSQVAEYNPDLFRKVISVKGNIEYQCNYKIQKLFLDNTFCDPIFMFPPRSYALKLMVKVIEEYKPKKVFLCTDSIGKQEAFIYLSKKYNSKVKINKDRLNYIKCMGIDHQKYFTLKDQPGCWIQVIRKADKQTRVSQQKNSIAITLTGWANLNDYHPVGYNSFVVPYSLHSNYKQIEMFVRWIRPKKIIPIVFNNDEKKGQEFREKIGSYESYMVSLCFIKQRGLEYLKSQHETNYDDKQFYQNHQNQQNQQTIFQI